MKLQTHRTFFVSVLIYALLILASPFAIAQTQCDPNGKGRVIERQLTIASPVLDQFVRPDKRAKDFWWVFPDTWCVGAGSKIEFRDEENAVVGTMEVSQAETVEFNFINAEKKDAAPFVKSFYQWLRSIQTNTFRAIDLLMRLNYGVYDYMFRPRITLTRGNFKQTPNYRLYWYPQLPATKVFGSKSPNYETLINLIIAGKLEPFDVGRSNYSESSWRIPKGRPGGKIFGNMPRWELLSFEKLTNELDGTSLEDFPTNKDTPILLHSEDDNSMNAGNAALVLRANGYTQVYWNSNLVKEWFGRNSRVDREADLTRPINVVELKKKLTDKSIRLFDLRDESDYFAGTIPGAKMLSGGFVTGEIFLKNQQKYFPNRTQTGFEDLEPDEMYFMADLPVLKNVTTPVILFRYGGRNENKLLLVHQGLRRAGFKEIYVYTDGFADWFTRSKWTPEQGYPIEIPKTDRD